MSFIDVATILKSVGAITEQDAVLPTDTDLAVRLRYINDALGEWSDSYTWDDLRVTYQTTTNNSLTSLGLPLNFRQPLSSLWVYSETKTNGEEYPIIQAGDRFGREPSEYYCYLYGTFRNKSIQIPNTLPSGASLTIDYMSFPSSVATTTDYLPISSSQYVVKRVSAMVFQSRGDSRYPLLQQDAERFLSNAIEEQNVPFGRRNQIATNTNFIIGRD